MSERLIIDSHASWSFDAITGPYRTARELRVALQGLVLRCGWALDQMAQGGYEDGEIQPLRVAPASVERIRKTIAALLFEIREAEVIRNPAFDAHADPAVQQLIAQAMNPAPAAKARTRRRKPSPSMGKRGPAPLPSNVIRLRPGRDAKA